MQSLVCTLFEGDYHLGAAALINSLWSVGFDGEIVAGFRGKLPHWANGREEMHLPPNPAGLNIHVRLVPLQTRRHLTNFKPDFMLDHLASSEVPIWYLDPDIVVTAPWAYFTEWLECGIALCEDVNAIPGENHPRRVAWRRYFGSRGFELRFRQPAYVNGGFIGVQGKDRAFLEAWRALQEAMSDAIGGLEQSKLSGGTSLRMRDPLFAFNASDQDALNATIEACPEFPVSVVGPEAMGFRSGATILPHALGVPKPWQKEYLREAFRGYPPSPADRAFWRHAEHPVRVCSPKIVRQKERALRLAALVGRFYQRR